MHKRIREYLNQWTRKGYSNGIPDEVPNQLMYEGLAPSYKAVAIAILKNDHALQSLGFSMPFSPWYQTLKSIELQQRRNATNIQLSLF